jgi:hypothetical protein
MANQTISFLFLQIWGNVLMMIQGVIAYSMAVLPLTLFSLFGHELKEQVRDLSWEASYNNFRRSLHYKDVLCKTLLMRAFVTKNVAAAWVERRRKNKEEYEQKQTDDNNMGFSVLLSLCCMKRNGNKRKQHLSFSSPFAKLRVQSFTDYMIYQNIAIGNGRFCKSCNH